MMNDDLVIRKWLESDDAEELTELLHMAYHVHAMADLRFLATHQDVGVTLSRMEGGETWVGCIGKKIVATVTLYEPDSRNGCEFYRSGGVAVFGQFAVLPEYQKRGIGKQMILLVERQAMKMNAVFLACDTSEKAVDLIGMYRNWGYEKCGVADWRPEVNYKSVILAKKIAG